MTLWQCCSHVRHQLLTYILYVSPLKTKHVHLKIDGWNVIVFFFKCFLFLGDMSINSCWGVDLFHLHRGPFPNVISPSVFCFSMDCLWLKILHITRLCFVHVHATYRSCSLEMSCKIPCLSMDFFWNRRLSDGLWRCPHRFERLLA